MIQRITHDCEFAGVACDELRSIPTPARVRAVAAEIRRSWTPRERHRRALLARYFIWQAIAASQ